MLWGLYVLPRIPAQLLRKMQISSYQRGSGLRLQAHHKNTFLVAVEELKRSYHHDGITLCNTDPDYGNLLALLTLNPEP